MVGCRATLIGHDGIIDVQEYDGKPFRIFFARDPYGVCFCFTQPTG